MNIQAMMKQAQKMQKDMMSARKEIDESTFEGNSSFVTVTISGDKKLLEVKISEKEIHEDDIEMLQDIIVLAVNDAMNKVDEMTNEKMGKYTQGMPGLF